MAKEICISSTPHETRLAILEDDQLAEIYYERENEYTLAGSIYKGRVTRVLPGMQSAFVDVGLERDAFLYVSDFLEEQEEESAEFDRADGNGNGRRGREGREPREAREPRPREPETGGELQAAEGAPRHSESHDGEAQGATRRWQGRRGRRFRGRGRDRGEQDRGERTERPRNDAAFESPQMVEEAIAAEPVALPERGAPGGFPAQNLPIVLPGESLSKYGRGRNESQPRPTSAAASSTPVASASTAKPSTLVEVPSGWDGGSVLPGESLSRHRRNQAPRLAEAVVTESPAEESPIAESQMEPASGESAASVAAEVAEKPVAAVAERIAETVTEPVAIAAAPEPETVEEVHEYEPEDASASHRMETPRSEFRVSPPVEEEEVEEIVEEEESGARIEQEPAYASQETAESQQPPEACGPASPEAEVVRQLFGYAPGMGVLEEETIDEDEYDFEPIPAQHEEHGSEELEEETLDQAATVGDAVREVHIERRLGYGSPAEAEEDEETGDLETGFAETDEAELDEAEGEDELDEPAAEAGEESAIQGESPAPSRREGRRFDRRGGRGRQGRRHGGRRPNMQTSSLPIISELLKQGQEILVQIAKEPIARKGARITSHIALPGRFLVFMPTVNHVGVSRKIASDEERQRLKRILISEKGTAGGGFIVRTAAESASEDDLRADIRFLINLWTEIKQRSDNAKAPALIYHDLNLIERILRDQVSDNFSTIWVDSETEYERIVRFLNRFQPSLVRRVKLYTKETPLFEQFGIQDEISKALKSKVWLKSGGSIVINQTEALVAIDINTGKYVGKTARLEDTILKTNLDAIPEIVRQVRLRDLGGIIVIDFIDMDERRNRQKVTQALEDALKADRAPSKVLQFNDFGLVAITRKRVKQSLERTLSVGCPICTGTGMVKSPVTVANEIWVEMRKMMRHFERNDVLLRVHPEVVKVLKGNNAKWLNELEEMIGKTLIVKSDPALPPEQFDIQG
jgi:Rne/Rng family ribonuclease